MWGQERFFCVVKYDKMIEFFKTGKRKSPGKTRELKNISKATSASQEGVWRMELKMVQVR